MRMLGTFIAVLLLVAQMQAADRPKVLFIAVDDLNDWISPLGGHPQTKTPHFERLAKQSMLFTNAYCAAPSCNPSRTAIFTGIPPHRSGLYDNRQKMREVLPDAELLPKYFSRHGYWSAGSGKLLHYFIDAPSWDDYFPAKDKEDPFPFIFYPKQRPVSLPVSGPWQYVETDWAALDVTAEQFGGDWLVTKWIGEQLQREHDKAFFLACDIYRPHEPWFVPKQYFEHIQKQNQWKQGVQAYLASIHFADAMLGRVSSNPVPASKPDGTTFEIVFINQTVKPVELCWMDPQGNAKSYGQIKPKTEQRQQTRPGAVWLIRDDSQQPLGHFQVGDRTAKAIIPAP